MRLTPILALLFVAILLGAIIWYLEGHSETVEERHERTAKVLRLAGEDTTDFTIERGDYRLVCMRKDGAWFLRQPVQARAAEGAVERILSVLELLPRKEAITAEERRSRDLRFADYGLRPPRARILLHDSRGRKELLLGADAPVGNLVYVKLSSSEDVVATTRDVLDITTNRAENLRDRLVFHGDASRVTRLEIRQPAGLVQLGLRDGEWAIQQPISAWADRARVTDLLDRLFAMRAEAFVWDPPLRAEAAETAGSGEAAASGVRAETYGLVPDMAAGRLVIWTADDPLGKELLLGKPVKGNDGLVYAKLRENDSVFAVERSFLAMCSAGVNDLRDRDIFRMDPASVRYLRAQAGDVALVLERSDESAWMITEPVQWKADSQTAEALLKRVTRLRAESFVSGDVTNLALFGLASPAWSLQVLSQSPSRQTPAAAPDADGVIRVPEKAAAKEHNLLRVALPQDDKPTVAARLDDGDTIFEIASDALRGLGKDITDPLALRDRTILSVAPASLRKIVLLRQGKEQSVARTESGEWTALDPEAAEVNANVVEDLLLSVAHLRAVRIECQNPKILAVYGLDQPGIILTLGLSGEQGIQKSLMIGFRAKTDGLYAMIQGQDLVFVVAQDVVELLSRDLTMPVPAGVKPQDGDGSGGKIVTGQ